MTMEEEPIDQGRRNFLRSFRIQAMDFLSRGLRPQINEDEGKIAPPHSI